MKKSPEGFFSLLEHTFFHPAYYADIVRMPIRRSFRFYLLYLLLISLINSGFFAFTRLPSLRLPILFANQNSLVPEVLKNYPFLFNLAWPVILLSVFSFSFISLAAFQLIYLIPFALVFKAISKIFSLPLSYWRSYQIGLHLIIVSTTLLSLLKVFGLSLAILPSQSLFMLGLAALVIRKIQ